MAEAYSSYVVESHGGKTRAYVKGYVESETDKTATIYVWACANANRLTQYGVRVRAYINGTQVATKTENIFSASGVKNVGACSGRLTINKGSSAQNITISGTIAGVTYNGYGPIAGSRTASTKVYVGAKVLRPPSAPGNLKAARNASANIVLSWTNNATNATSTLIERQQKGGSWTQIVNQSSVITSYTDSPGIGSFRYRVRYKNADGYSGYSNVTDYVVTLCAPAAPTLISPASGATINANDQAVRVAWQHNSIDSSDQTEARLSYSNDNETWIDILLATEKEYLLPIAEQNATYYWKVATRGAHADFGQASGVSHYLVRTAPVALLSVMSPIEQLPIPVIWEYEDAFGTQAFAVLEVFDANETVVYSKQVGNENSYTISAEEFTPKHEETYTLRLTVTSTTSLSYTTQAVISVNYVPPAKPRLAIATNTQQASNTIRVFSGIEDEATPPTTYLALFRDGDLIATELYPNSSFLDETPPLDRPVEYRAVAYAESGSASEKTEVVQVPSKGFVFFNFGNQVAKVGMNIAIRDETKNEKEHYTTASSKYPKVFYGEHSERTGQITAEAFWAKDLLDYGEEAMLSAIEALKEYSGLVYMRLPYSDAFMTSVDVSTDLSTEMYNIAAVSIEWRRVE